jgi:hypothetical protein
VVLGLEDLEGDERGARAAEFDDARVGGERRGEVAIDVMIEDALDRGVPPAEEGLVMIDEDEGADALGDLGRGDGKLVDGCARVKLS